MGKKKKAKKEKMTIKGAELVRKTRTPYQPAFKSGGHMTEKDRPRKRFRPRDVDD
jgi:hypothetical protein